jgi:small-conductance mechanosensitive channel
MLAYLESLRPWTLAVAYVVFWAAVGLVVRTLLRRSLQRLGAVHKTAFNEVLAGSLPRPAGIAVFLFAMSYGVRTIRLPDRLAEHAGKIFPVAFGVLAIAVLMRVALRSIDAYGKSNPELRSSAGIGKAGTWIGGLAAIALFVSDALGISLAPALTALGVGSLAVGLGLQDTLSNFFAGLYLLADKPVRQGDFVRIETYEGTVESIGWRSTHLRTPQNNLVIVPNAALSKAILTNFDRPSREVAVDVRVDVALDADIDKLEDALRDEAQRAAAADVILPQPPPVVRFAPGYVDGALGFTISFRAKSVADQLLAQHEVRRRVLARLKKDGIPLPPPRFVR